ncbi:MAG: hypothetical protein R2839_08190 [Thermomicrobiales bacterium]
MTAAPYQAIKADHWVFEEPDCPTATSSAGNLCYALPRRRIRTRNGQNESLRLPEYGAIGQGDESGRRRRRDGTFETESGGAVFSVGSITWPASVLVDSAISQITNNVLQRFLNK